MNIFQRVKVKKTLSKNGTILDKEAYLFGMTLLNLCYPIWDRLSN